MKILTRILRILVYAGVIGLVFLGILALFTQTQFFRDRVKIILASALADRINGTLHVGTMRGNFLNELSFDSLGVSYNDQPVFTSGKVTIQYELLPLLKNTLRLRYLIIEQPKMYVVRSEQGDWNFEKLIKPSTDTVKRAFTLSGTIDDVELKNGMLSVVDSASLLSPGHSAGPSSSIEYHHVTLKDINIRLSGAFKHNDIAARIIHASFYSDRPQFELTHFKGEFAATERGLTASNIIVQTSKSYLELDAKLRGTNIFLGLNFPAMREDSVQLQVKAGNLDFGELKTFIPEVGFLNGSAQLDLRAGGPFGDLDIQSLRLKTYQSTLDLSGSIRNLHNPGELYLNIVVGESRIHPRDLARLMPPLSLPPFDSAGQATLAAEFIGRPLSFTSRAIIRGTFGQIDASGTMNLARPIPSYDVTATTRNLDLGRIFAGMASTSLSLHGTAKGEGLSLDSIRAELYVHSDSSRIRNLRIDSAQLTIAALPHRLDATLAMEARAMRADLNVHGTFPTNGRPEFSSEVSLGSFNLATLFNDNRLASDLTLRGTIALSGTTIDDFSTDSKLTLLPSTFRGHDLDQQEVHLFLDQHDASHKRLSLGSSIADIDLSGRFDLDYAYAILPEHLVNLATAIRDHALPPESVKTVYRPLNIREHTALQRIMDFDYSAQIKDLGPIATLFSPSPFDARAALKGTMRTTNDVLAFTCNGLIDEFYVGSSDSGAIINDCALQLTLDSLTNRDPLERLSAAIDLDFRSGMVNNLRFDSSSISLRYKQSRGTLSMNGTLDSLYHLILSGETSIQPGTYVVDVDTFRFSSGQYSWNNNQDVQFRLNSEGIRVMHAEMVRNEETVSLAGGLRYSGAIDVAAGVHDYDLAGLGSLVPNKEFSMRGQGFTGRMNADLHLAGSLMNPIVEFSAEGNGVNFRQTHVGTVKANISYKDTIALVTMTVAHSPKDSIPSLDIRGNLPINFALTGVRERFPDIPQNLHISSKGFDLAVLDPLLREFDDLSGTLTCDVTVGGTPRAPEFSGLISLNAVSFLFTPNYTPYTLTATLQPSGERIILQNFVLRNVATDGPTGEAHLTGSLTIRNYKVASFDVTATGQLLVMSEATRRTGATLYGPLLTETDPEGLTLSGTLERPFLSGKLLVRDANLLSPPAREALASSQLALNRIVVDDTSKVHIDSLVAHPSKFYVGTGLLPVGATRPRREGEISLVDRLRYNLTVETQGTTAIKMVFTPATNEELYAELDGRVSVINEQGVPNVYGEITVLPRSYYYFFKKFEAEGRLNFVGQWDNPELAVTARYEGTRTIDQSQFTSSNTNASEQLKSTTEQRVVVILDISGTRYEPKLSMSLKVQPPGTSGDENLVDWSTSAKGGDVQSDAISFILTGKFKEDLSSGEQRDIASSVGSTAGNSLTSNLVSGILTDVLRQKFPAIRSAEFSYDNGRPNVRVSGEAFKGRFQVGANFQDEEGRGRFDPNVRYQISVGEITANRSLRNLFIELQRRDTSFNDERKTLETRIYYRFSF